MVDNFEFKLISDFKGYNSSRDKTNLDEAFAVRGSKNVYKKLSGTWANRPGLKRRGSADSTFAGVDSSGEWVTSFGKTYPLRVCNSKLQVESDITGSYVWYDLMTSLTKTRFVFDFWWNNTLKKDMLICVKGDSNLHAWHGGIGTIVSTTINTITLNDTAASLGFPSTGGNITINGNSYAFTATSGADLTGVTGDPRGEANGSVVLSAIITTSNKPASGYNNDFIKVISNQLYVGSYSSRLVYISDQTDYTDFTVPATPVAGDPELLTLDQTAKGITSRQGKAHIGAGDSLWYIISFANITVGTTLARQTVVDRKQLGSLTAPIGHEFIEVVGDTIVYIAQDNQFRTYGDYRNIFTPAYPSLSQAIFDELKEEDFTGGHVKSIGDFLYITAPISGRVYLHQTRQSVDSVGNIVSERLWHPPQVWNISRVAVIDGIAYGHSNSNPQIYELWDTGQWHDDSPADEPLPYDSVLRMAYRNHGRRQGILSFDKAYYEGYISQGTNLNAMILYDYQGAENLIQENINSNSQPAYLIAGNSAPSIGDAPIGDNPLGDGLTEVSNDQELLPKFKTILSLTPVNCFEYQMVVYSSDVDSRWELLCLGTNAALDEEEQAYKIIKK